MHVYRYKHKDGQIQARRYMYIYIHVYIFTRTVCIGLYGCFCIHMHKTPLSDTRPLLFAAFTEQRKTQKLEKYRMILMQSHQASQTDNQQSKQSTRNQVQNTIGRMATLLSHEPMRGSLCRSLLQINLSMWCMYMYTYTCRCARMYTRAYICGCACAYTYVEVEVHDVHVHAQLIRVHHLCVHACMSK